MPSDYIDISTPGQIPKIQIGFDIPEGDAIDPALVVISSNYPDYLSGADVEVSEETRRIDGVDYPAGAVIQFTLVCAANSRPSTNQAPAFVYIDYETFGDSVPEKLNWTKRVVIHDTRIPLD